MYWASPIICPLMCSEEWAVIFFQVLSPLKIVVVALHISKDF